MLRKKELEEKQVSLEKLGEQFLLLMDKNSKRAGLAETPKRFAKYWMELLEGQFYSNKEIAKMFGKTFEECENSGLVVETNIPIFSTCEHHLALMYDMRVSIAYLPHGKIIGISKMARIAELVGKRLQLQERIGNDIREIMEMILGTNDIAVVIRGKHSCMTARGIKSRESIIKTASMGGKFLKESGIRDELYQILKI